MWYTNITRGQGVINDLAYPVLGLLLDRKVQFFVVVTTKKPAYLPNLYPVSWTKIAQWDEIDEVGEGARRKEGRFFLSQRVKVSPCRKPAADARATVPPQQA